MSGSNTDHCSSVSSIVPASSTKAAYLLFMRWLVVTTLLAILASGGMMELETGLFRAWYYGLPPMERFILLIDPVVVIGIAW
jgi:hypothetical protein